MYKRNGTTLMIQVPEELDHHAAEEIRTEADFLLKTQEIRRLVFDFSHTVQDHACPGRAGTGSSRK